MTALELAGAVIERVNADLAVVPLFEAERPLRSAAGRIDWRLCGRLSRLLAEARIDGGWGEALLTPGGGGVRAPRILGLGLGNSAQLDLPRWEAWVGDALDRAAGLGAGRIALALPESGEALAERLNALAARARSQPAPEEILVAVESPDAAVAAQWFRAMARRVRHEGLEIHPPAVDGPPQGGRPASPAAQSARSSRATAGRSTR